MVSARKIRLSWQPKLNDSKLLKTLGLIRDQILAASSNSPNIANCRCFAGGRGIVAAYDFFRTHGIRKKWNTVIWSPYIPRKYTLCAWRAIRGRLSTLDRLGFLNQSQVCILCNSYNESHKHLFFECSATKSVWEAIKAWLHIRPGSSTILSAIKWCEKDHCRSSIIRKARRLALSCFVYFIWYHRNLQAFQNLRFDHRKVINCIKTQTFKILYDIFSPDLVHLHIKT